MRSSLANILLLPSMTILTLAFSPAPVNNTKGCLECHSKVIDQNYIHAPAEKSCVICHKSNGKAHPEAGVKGFTLVAETPDLCYSCHEEIQRISHKASFPHQAMTGDKNCLNCHSSHASAEKKLLLYEETKTCLGCHNKSVSSKNKPILNMYQFVLNNTYSHAVISKSGCSGCHMPHGSPNPFILQGTYRAEIYTSSNKESFLVCFTCHNTGLLLDETTTTATGFRNGKQNLHYVHIQDSKTRRCISCHNVHGAMNPRLIAEKVLFGKWEMPIRFRILENGGSCAPGCHSEKMYKR